MNNKFEVEEKSKNLLLLLYLESNEKFVKVLSRPQSERRKKEKKGKGLPIVEPKPVWQLIVKSISRKNSSNRRMF